MVISEKYLVVFSSSIQVMATSTVIDRPHQKFRISADLSVSPTFLARVCEDDRLNRRPERIAEQSPGQATGF
jgi:hypothetical protein